MDMSPLGPVGGAGLLDTVCRPSPLPDGPFARVLGQYLATGSAQQASADKAVMELALGCTDDVHQVMLAVARADLTFRTILEVRNRITDAYQEIMRLQV